MLYFVHSFLLDKIQWITFLTLLNENAMPGSLCNVGAQKTLLTYTLRPTEAKMIAMKMEIEGSQIRKIRQVWFLQNVIFFNYFCEKRKIKYIFVMPKCIFIWIFFGSLKIQWTKHFWTLSWFYTLVCTVYFHVYPGTCSVQIGKHFSLVAQKVIINVLFKVYSF